MTLPGQLEVSPWSNPSAGADELKAHGNAAIKCYKLDDAIESYSAAMAEAPGDAVCAACNCVKCTVNL